MTDRTLTLFGEHFFNHTDVELVLSYYPASEYKTVDIRAADILGDAFFVCPTRRTVRALAAANKSPVYDYYFNFDMKTVCVPCFPRALSSTRAGERCESENPVCCRVAFPFSSWSATCLETTTAQRSRT